MYKLTRSNQLFNVLIFVEVNQNLKIKRKFFGSSPHSAQEDRRLPFCQTKPGTAVWSISDKGSEVRAVKRLLTSHFICQTFISLFMVQRSPSVQARLHTCAWNTFRASSPPFHDLIGEGNKWHHVSAIHTERHKHFVHFFPPVIISLIFMSTHLKLTDKALMRVPSRATAVCRC